MASFEKQSINLVGWNCSGKGVDSMKAWARSFNAVVGSQTVVLLQEAYNIPNGFRFIHTHVVYGGKFPEESSSTRVSSSGFAGGSDGSLLPNCKFSSSNCAVFLPICYVDFVQEFIFDKYIFCLLLRVGSHFCERAHSVLGQSFSGGRHCGGTASHSDKNLRKYGMCDIVKSIENCRPRPDSISIGI